jgi:hypothetical protein
LIQKAIATSLEMTNENEFRQPAALRLVSVVSEKQREQKGSSFI